MTSLESLLRPEYHSLETGVDIAIRNQSCLVGAFENFRESGDSANKTTGFLLTFAQKSLVQPYIQFGKKHP